MNFIPLLQAAQGGSWIMMVSLGAVIAIFYFFVIGPQKKEQKKTQEMINALQKGDKVITIGGIHGVVSSAKDKTVIIKVDDNCKLEVNRTAIGTVIADEKRLKEMKDAEQAAPKFSLFGKKKAEPKAEEPKEEPKCPDFR
ncbi:preprotein translocase subunit YajC [Treponema phagedenis]|uniref:Sec translocon accessory complex subunit YajC n=1 Tax=Treponema phagedenis TaxID=162 RepID=A0A0B7GY68_TREPH|nr:preprotein translocase subunit YajC [Treponema phagedenis]NVP25047.1 preprotein translocase subunit YajC [Treponema phagedenis]QEJ94039.1 preprotein translocase subunit YajC [Treponema phagedenis]QEJ97162.1 preprotein translocase subunit YajC [Treponema phagedenis]QEK01951.1 preprotein translocase subunit YajC [Treponema phagedenis]QEK02649.1 preprotein translocase subunit YajC [Treponema phagedenis]